MSSFKDKLLIFVEDPGAANFIVPLLKPLEKIGCSLFLYTDGAATKYLNSMNINTLSIDLNISDLLCSIKPQLLMVGTSENPDTVGLKMIVAARDLKIPSIGVVDGPANAEYRFKGRGNSPLQYVTDWLFVPDKWTCESYISLGFPLEKIKICGHPYYDSIIERSAAYKSKSKIELRKKYFPNVSKDKSIVIFLTEKSDGLNPESLKRSSKYTLTGRGKSDLRTEIIMEEFIDTLKTIDQDLFLVVRLHPKENTSDYENYINVFDAVSHGEDPMPLLFSADLIVGMSSSLLVEATILGLNTLSILPHEGEKDLISTVRTGHTPYATNRETLKILLSDLLKKDKKTNFNVSNLYPDDSIKKVTNAISSLCY